MNGLLQFILETTLLMLGVFSFLFVYIKLCDWQFNREWEAEMKRWRGLSPEQQIKESDNYMQSLGYDLYGFNADEEEDF